MGPRSMQSFVVGMHGAFIVSLGLSLVAALFSLARGSEDRGAHAAPVQEF